MTTYTYPSSHHTEVNEDGVAHQHPGYDMRMCHVCQRPYPVGKGAFDPGFCCDYKCTKKVTPREGGAR